MFVREQWRQERSAFSPSRLMAGSSFSASRLRLPVSRHGELKRRPRLLIVPCTDLAAMGLDDRPTDRESHAQAGCLSGEESAEQLVCYCRIDAGAVVDHRHDRLAGFIPA